MRDDHLIVEKIDLSLERRQVALLSAVALVLLGGVFALGVLVGRQLAVAALSSPRAAAGGDLSALDAQRDEAALAVKAAAVAQPAAQLPAQTRPPAAAQARRTAEEGGPAADPERTGPAERSVAIKPAPKVATIAGPKAARQAPGPLSPPPQNLGAFTVQLGASQDQAEARRLEARARGAGLRAYVVEANLGAKGVWYRVRAGAFPSREAADRYRKDVERELRATAVVMPSR